MGWLSTYQQLILAPNGIDGKSLKDKLLEDGVIGYGEDGKAVFNKEKTGISAEAKHDFYYSDKECFTEKGDGLACTFWIDNVHDFVDGQIEGAKQFSKLYPDATFLLHSSYCPGGGGERTTCLDGFISNGLFTDARGQECEYSLIIPKGWIFELDESDPSHNESVGIDLPDPIFRTISRNDYDIDDEGICRIYMRGEDSYMASVLNMCQEKLEAMAEAARNAEYEYELAQQSEDEGVPEYPSYDGPPQLIDTEELF